MSRWHPPGTWLKARGTPKECLQLDKYVEGRRFIRVSPLKLRDYLSYKDFQKASLEWYAFTLEKIRRARLYGERPKRRFVEASRTYFKENERCFKDSIHRDKLLTFANGYVGGVYIDELSPYHPSVKQLIEDLRGLGRKNKTINNHIEVISTVLRFCTEYRDSEGITWLKTAPKFPLLPLTDARSPKVLRWSEQDVLLASTPTHLRDMFTFMVNTGLRVSELCSLKWDHVISVGSVSTLSFPRLKNDLILPVVLNYPCREILSYLENSCSKKSNTTVFSCKSSQLKTGWKKYVQSQAGLGWDLRLHDLRHTYGHRLLEAGCPLDIRRVMMGHTPDNITSHYSLASLETMLEYAEKVSCRDELTPVFSVGK